MTGADSPRSVTPPVDGVGGGSGGELQVAVQPNETATVVAVEGELDLDTAPMLRSALSEVLDDERTANVTLDVAGLEFIDSTGLRIIVEAVSRLGERGGELVIHGPRPSTLKVLEICGLAQSVRITGA